MPQADAALLVYFEDPPLGSVADEVTSLSRDALIVLLGEVKEVYYGQQDYRRLKVWRTYGGVPLFKPEHHGEMLIYAVENLGDYKRPVAKVSMLFAGVRKTGYVGVGAEWDGENDEMLWLGVIEPRCRRHFGA